MTALAHQLHAELGARAQAWAPWLPAHADLSPYLDHVVSLAASQLTSDDDALVAQTVDDLLCLLWPGEVPDEWWRTPVGRVCGLSLDLDDEAVSVPVAQAMLGVSRARVYQLIDAGHLERHPAGGVTRISVHRRLR